MPPLPDAAIHPVATGPAARIVEAHKEDQPLVFYSGWFCPFVQRAWITLEEKYKLLQKVFVEANAYRKLPYRYVEVNPYLKEPWYLKLNPRGLVPTLECPQQNGATAVNGDCETITRKPLIDSNIICDYLEETYPTEHKLWPTDTYDKARMRVWMDFVTSRIIPSFHRFLQHTEKSSYSIEDARKELLDNLKTWIKEADPEGPYFNGRDFSMADVCLAPWGVRLWVFDHFKQGGLGLPERGKGGEDETTWVRWRKWTRAIENRPSVKQTLSDAEYYLPLWQRYADDEAQSEMAKASRAGRGVP